MKIVEFHAENVKRLKLVSIKPNGDTIVIGGENGAGKTTVLDCIDMAFAGAKKVASVPVRTGQTAAKVLIDTGELKIERRFSTASGTSLIVTGADGKRIASPQAVLDKLYSAVAFNPLEFAGQDSGKQAATLRRIVGLDFAALDAERARIYQEREASGRILAQTKARLAAMPAPAANVLAEEVSVAALMAQKEDAEQINQSHAQVRRQYEQARERTEEAARVVENLRKQLAVAEEQYAGLKTTENSAQDAVAELADDIDTAPIVEKIKGAESINRAVRAKAERARVAAELAALETARTESTEAIGQVDAEKAAKLAAAKWPVDGLGFSDDGVTYRGLPFDQASQSERLRVSVAIGIALNPTLRVLLIRDASLLDKASMATLRTLAVEHDVQLWIERVGDGDEGAVILEDGEVKAPATGNAG